MLDSLLRPKLRAVSDRIAGRVVAGGMGANALTLSGFVVGLSACFAVAVQFYPMALLLFLISRALKALACAAARIDAITPRGCYFDLLCDFILFGAFVFFFALGAYEHLMGAGFLLFAYLTLFTAWMAQGLFDPNRTTPEIPQGGLIGQSEMIVFTALCCLLPAYFSAFAAVFGLACFAAAAIRIMRAVKALSV